MENLQFALNATVPIFLLIIFGYFLKLVGWLKADFAAKISTFVFRLLLPFALFQDLAGLDIEEAWNTKFILFCFFVTIISIAAAIVISRFAVSGSQRGEFIQASYRSSAAILGLAFIQNIYGTSGMAQLMILGSVPLYNICAVLVLTITSPENEGKKITLRLVGTTLLNVIRNPIIIGVAAGFVWSALKLPTPEIMINTVSKIGGCATTMGLMAMGACFEAKKAVQSGKGALIAAFMKLIGYGLVFVPIAYALGFRNEEMVAILVMLCSATTVTSFVMAKSMGHDGVLTSAAVMITTLLAAVTLTIWLFILRSVGAV